MRTPLKVGDLAADFSLPDQFGADFDSAARPESSMLLVVFFPFAFSGICTGELSAIRDDLARFSGDDLRLACVSCDPIFTLRAWADQEGYFFPLLSDFWPHGELASSFGVFEDTRGLAVRGSFLVGAAGEIVWSQVNDPGTARDWAGYDAAVAAQRA